MAVNYKICSEGVLVTSSCDIPQPTSYTSSVTYVDTYGCDVLHQKTTLTATSQYPSDNAFRIFYQLYEQKMVNFEIEYTGTRREGFITMPAGATVATKEVDWMIRQTCDIGTDGSGDRSYDEMYDS